MDKLPDEKIQQLLKQVANHFDQEDRIARQRQLRSWRHLKLLWEGFTRVWYSEVNHDWRIWEQDLQDSSAQDGIYYDKPINVFRAYLESIIAALSINVPAVTCYPEDADNPMDISTAKAADKIGALLYRCNDAPMLWLHALYIMCTEGVLTCYTYPKEDEDYGTVTENIYEDTTESYTACPNCGEQTPSNSSTPQPTDNYSGDINQAPGLSCPECGQDLTGVEPITQPVQKLINTITKPKVKICMECYGGLYVKIPNYAMKQEDIPYLIFSYETHYANAIERYDHLRDKLSNNSKVGPSGGGVFDPYEQWARLSPQYRGAYPLSNVTVRNSWLRPASFNILPAEDAALLKKHYPKGAKVVLVNDQFADVCEECLDTCWTILQDPLSDYLIKQPIGSLLVNIQDITNEIISLTLQTIEHGISQTFADPTVLNFDKYRQSEATPGSVYPATAKTGKSVSEGFYETRTASLSSEVLPFFGNIQSLGQTVSGAQPALFGGQLEGSRTASEYSMSRAQALQRLQNIWKMLLIWWKDVNTKAIPMYIEEAQEDEKYVESDDNGNFVNVFIRKSELDGKIGRIELEANENLPITWAQRKDIYMKLLEINNPQILEALASPENVKNLVEAIGLDDFTVPGESDREKQYEEINLLINSEPILQPPDPMEVMAAIQMGQPPPQETEVSSVEIDPDVDNHDVEADICRTYLVSEAGRLLRVENPIGYKNVLLHMKAHMQMIAQSQQAQMLQSAQQASQQSSTGTSTPLAESQDVAASA